MNRRVSRRNVLFAMGAAPVIAACSSATKRMSTSTTRATSSSGSKASKALWIPPAITGTHFDLDLATSSAKLRTGAATSTIAFNGASIWGPTLIMQAGDDVSMSVTNHLREDTTTHWHGLHLPAEMDGGPHQVIAAGATWEPSWTVKNRAATYWYHPHAHELTWKQLNQGAGGFIIVRDDTEAALDLPRTYGVDDIPLVLTSRALSTANVIDTERIYGDHLLANGVIGAVATVPAQMVRFRILNAEIERAYDIGIDDGREFAVIGTDGGLLDAPVATKRLLMYPGERYEIVIDLTGAETGSSLRLMAYNTGKNDREYPGSEPTPPGGTGGAGGGFSSLLNNRDFELLTVVAKQRTKNAVTSLPTTLVPTGLWTAADATNARTITINDGVNGRPFYFDDSVYAMDRIDERVVLDTTEAWTIQNTHIFSHSFHMHDVQFAIVERGRGPIPDYEKGWKDTFHISPDEAVTFVARFDDYASTEHPFMYHCHMANHEDEGMMGQFLVVPA